MYMELMGFPVFKLSVTVDRQTPIPPPQPTGGGIPRGGEVTKSGPSDPVFHQNMSINTRKYGSILEKYYFHIRESDNFRRFAYLICCSEFVFWKFGKLEM